MKITDSILILFVLALMSACQRPSELKSGSANSPVDASRPSVEPVRAADEKEDEPNLNFVDRKLKGVGEPPLRGQKLSGTDLEVRVWKGFGIRKTIGVLLRRRMSEWSGTVVAVDSSRRAAQAQKRIVQPNSDWETFWRRLEDRGIRSLRDDAEVGAVEPFEDSELVLIEVLVADYYRTYSYNAPCFSTVTEAKAVVEIVKIISDEIDGSFSPCEIE